MIRRDLSNSNNERVIIFLTDGNPRTMIEQGIELENLLKSEYGVNSFYVVAYNLFINAYLNRLVNIYKPNSEAIHANSSNIAEAFKDILYKVNASAPELKETEDGRLDISDMEVSAKKPMSVIVAKNGTIINTITITEYPTSSEGVIIIENGKMYLSVDALREACGLEDFEGVEVSIEYYSI